MKQIKLKAIFLLCWVLLIFFWGSSAFAKTAQEIAKVAFRSTVLLVMEDANGQTLSLGSGFFVGDGVIASNLHVIEGAKRGYAKLIGEKTKYAIEGIIAVDPERDLVVLKITNGRSHALPLGNSDSVQVGENVYAVGNPHGLEGTFSQGIISSIREVSSEKLLQITAPISPGSSGGPVLNGKGEVIGVSVATFSGGQNLNFAIPSGYLNALLAKTTGPRLLLSQIMPAKATKSITSDLGGRISEGVLGGQFTWESQGVFQEGKYSLSLRNQLRENVKNVYCIVVFYDSQNNPIDVDVIQYQGIILAGLAKRVKSKVYESVQRLTASGSRKKPTTMDEFRESRTNTDPWVEIRVLDFEIVN